MGIALIVFVAAALGGLVLAILSFKGKKLPMPLSLGHGLLGAIGIVLLLLAVLKGVGGTTSGVALILFLVTALGGFFLFSKHLRGISHPKGVIVIHALAAVAGVGLLLLAMR